MKFKKYILIGLFAIANNMYGADNEELPRAVKTPIKYKKYFQQERELFGYKPKFDPNPVSFDNNNLPYMRTTGENPQIQTLDSNGNWIKLNFINAIKKKFPQWDGKIKTGPFSDERIVFDKKGNAFMIVNTGRSNLKKSLLLFSTDKCRSWEVFKLPLSEYFSLEFPEGHNLLENPPMILLVANPSCPKRFWVIKPFYTKSNRLKLSHAIEISQDSLLNANHSGGSNFCVSINDKVYIVWAGAKAIPGKEGTPQYIRTYNRKTNNLSKPVLLGVNGHGTVDPHNLPAITVDSKGILHVILGGHHDQFKYLHSLKPYDISSWSKAQKIGAPREPKFGSYTYPALICDKNDTLHIVSRWSGKGYYFRLVYMRKKKGQNWTPHKDLVVPFRPMYGCWYHKLNIDKQNNLYLNYWFYHNQMDQKTKDAYIEKWPNDGVAVKVKRNGEWDKNVRMHDPVMLNSSDSGDSWFISTTKNFSSNSPQS